MPLMIDTDWCVKHRLSCFSRSQLDRFFDRPYTVEEMLTRWSGVWSKMSNENRIWILTHANAWTDHQRNEWLARMATRALARLKKPDPRSRAVVKALLANDVTKKVRDGAHDVAGARGIRAFSRHYYVAWAVAYAADGWSFCAAAYAAGAAQKSVDTYANNDAAAESEYAAQIKDALDILRENP